jgi:hypothetical protein
VEEQSKPQAPLSVQLLPEIVERRQQLQRQWRRKKPPYDLVKAAKYMIWAEKGNEAMQKEAGAWFEDNEPIG